MRTRKLNKRQIANRKEYNKQVKRIRAGIKAVSEQGFDVSFIFPDLKGKNPTKRDINRLKNVSRETLRKTAYEYVNFNTGEILDTRIGMNKWREHRREYLKTTKEFPRETVMTIDQQYLHYIDMFRDLISDYRYLTSRGQTVSDIYEYVNNWLNLLIAEYGTERVGKMLYDGNKRGDWLSPREAYDAVKLERALNDMMDCLKIDNISKSAVLDEAGNFLQDEELWS